MARHEDEDVSELKLPAVIEPVVEFLGEKGESVTAEFGLAKSVTTTMDYENQSVQYFIKVGRGEIIDPYGADFGYTKAKLSSMYKFKKVSHEAFNQYHRYLQTKNRLYFTKARRLVME